MIQRLMLIVLSFFLVSTSLVFAAQADIKKFPETITIKDHVLVLQGVAQKRSLINKQFTAVFYLQDKVTGSYALSDSAKELDLLFKEKYNLKGLAAQIKRRFKQNLPKEEYKLIQSDLVLFEKLMPKVNKGDQLSVFYIPGVGTHFFLNDQQLGVIEGPVFAKGFFAAWVGENFIDSGIKNALLPNS